MRSMRLTMWMVGLMLLTAGGCASSPSFTGQWRADEVPENGSAAEQAMLLINDDRTFLFTAEDAGGQPVYAASGVWGQASPTKLRLYEDAAGGAASVTVEWLGKDTLRMIGGGDEGTFHRVK